MTGRLYGDESAFDSRRTGPFWKPSYWQDCPPISALSVNEDLFHLGHPQASSNPPLFAAQILKKSLKNRGVRFAKAPRVRVHPGTAWVVASRVVAPHVPAHPPDGHRVRQLLRRGPHQGARRPRRAPRHDRQRHAHDATEPPQPRRQAARREHRGRLGAVAGRPSERAPGRSASCGARRGSRGASTCTRRSRWRASAGRSAPGCGQARRTGTRHAKTGTLNTASALSGYVRSANGHRLVFSILQNRRPRLDVIAAHKLQDAIVQLLAGTRV